MAFFHHLRDPRHPARVAVGVIEKHRVACLHVVTHKVARLVVANAIPAGPPLFLQVGDAENVGLALHQPMLHQASFTTRASGESSNSRER